MCARKWSSLSFYMPKSRHGRGPEIPRRLFLGPLARLSSCSFFRLHSLLLRPGLLEAGIPPTGPLSMLHRLFIPISLSLRTPSRAQTALATTNPIYLGTGSLAEAVVECVRTGSDRSPFDLCVRRHAWKNSPAKKTSSAITCCLPSGTSGIGYINLRKNN